MNDDRPPRLMTVDEVAAMWGVSGKWVEWFDRRARVRFAVGLHRALMPFWRDLTDGATEPTPHMLDGMIEEIERSAGRASPFMGEPGGREPDVVTMLAHAREMLGTS